MWVFVMDDLKSLIEGDTPAGLLSQESSVSPPPSTSPPAGGAPLDWGIAPQYSPPPPPAPEMPVTAGEEETLVIPPAAPNANPFIPQGVTSAEQNGVQTPPAAGNPWFKRIVMIIIFFLVLLGVGIGVKYILGMVNGGKEVTITYWGLWEDGPTIQNAITDFQTVNPKIKVQYVKQSLHQYRERLQAAITRGDGPDVFQFHNTWVPMLRNELSPAPATFMTVAEFGTTFYPVASSDLVGGQVIYGVPLMFDGLGLYYNEDLFTAAAVKPPTTWPELLDIVPKLTVKTDTQIQQSAIALGTTGNVENFSDIAGFMMIQNGARLASPTGKEAEDTLTFYRKFANPSDPVYTWNETMDNSIYAFATSRVAMILAPSWRAFEIKQINPNLHFKIAPVPQLPGNTVNWASYWTGGVSTKSKYQPQAWLFLKYLISRDTMTKLYAEESKSRLFGEPYARVDLGSTLLADPYVGAYIQGAPTAKSFPLASRTFDNGINDKLIQYMTDAVNAVGQGTAPSAALQTAAAGFFQVLTSYGLASGTAPATTP
ncbi:MAG: extracellular solute-binding protein [Candidatus Gottesmanbacteria bacterium]|nr:extracellular solute-binding protein [Candidatus Gottesmanbacteria bacterium]